MKVITLFYAAEWRRFKNQLFSIFMTLFVLFIAITVVSAFYFKSHPALASKTLSAFYNSVPKIGIGIHEMLFLLLKNFAVAFFAIVLGSVPYLFLPILSLIANASMLGAFFYFVSQAVSLPKIIFAMLLPHGIFEIPAYLYAMSLGVYWCLTKMRRNRQYASSHPGDVQRQEIPAPRWNDMFYSLMLVILPLLLVAACIETFITPIIMRLIIK